MNDDRAATILVEALLAATTNISHIDASACFLLQEGSRIALQKGHPRAAVELAKRALLGLHGRSESTDMRFAEENLQEIMGALIEQKYLLDPDVAPAILGGKYYSLVLSDKLDSRALRLREWVSCAEDIFKGGEIGRIIVRAALQAAYTDQPFAGEYDVYFKDIVRGLRSKFQFELAPT